MEVRFEPVFIITTAAQFFKVNKITPRGRELLNNFQILYIQKAYQPRTVNPYRVPKAPEDKLFGFTTADGSEWRFHIGQLNHFRSYLQDKGFGGHYIIDSIPISKTQQIDSVMQPGWKLRDKQPEVVDFLVTPMQDDHNSRLVTLPMGYGKTATALWATCQRKKRTAVIVIPAYLEKWEEDIKRTTTAKPKDAMVVRGSEYIRGLIDLGKTGNYDSDFVLISMRSLMMFIDAYAEDPQMCREMYGCVPDELYDILGIGTVIIDEIHQHLHAVYRTFCFMNVELAIGLSGTFLSADYFVDKIQKMMFPKEIRFQAPAMKKYIRAYGISYTIKSDTLRLIKTTERGSTSYSQNAFEESIMKNKKIMHQYLQLIHEVVENGFMDTYKPGYKCIIFVRKVSMCEQVRAFLAMKYPHLTVVKYTEGDPYENLVGDADIRVTTQISGGTAHDIPGLMTNITLDNINSQQANLQCLGRLREPKEGVARYFTVFSENIQKHVRYYLDRKALFMDRVASFREFKSNIVL